VRAALTSLISLGEKWEEVAFGKSWIIIGCEAPSSIDGVEYRTADSPTRCERKVIFKRSQKLDASLHVHGSLLFTDRIANDQLSSPSEGSMMAEPVELGQCYTVFCQNGALGIGYSEMLWEITLQCSEKKQAKRGVLLCYEG